LKAPIERVALPDCPAPASRPLEAAYYPTADDIVMAVRKLG
jgi:acetoin:2,6-dichlorophenolindophenol oxidoreductase subunit beta